MRLVRCRSVYENFETVRVSNTSSVDLTGTQLSDSIEVNASNPLAPIYVGFDAIPATSVLLDSLPSRVFGGNGTDSISWRLGDQSNSIVVGLLGVDFGAENVRVVEFESQTIDAGRR